MHWVQKWFLCLLRRTWKNYWPQFARRERQYSIQRKCVPAWIVNEVWNVLRNFMYARRWLAWTWHGRARNLKFTQAENENPPCAVIVSCQQQGLYESHVVGMEKRTAKSALHSYKINSLEGFHIIIIIIIMYGCAHTFSHKRNILCAPKTKFIMSRITALHQAQKADEYPRGEEDEEEKTYKVFTKHHRRVM